MGTSSPSKAAKTTTHQDYDKWEKVPPSVSKPQNWEKTSKKRKNKNIRFEDSSNTEAEEIPELEVVFKIEEKTKEMPMEENDRFKKEVNKGLKKELDKVLTKEVNTFPEKRVTEVLDKESVPDEENANTEDTEQEKKKVRRRRKKHGSE